MFSNKSTVKKSKKTNDQVTAKLKQIAKTDPNQVLKDYDTNATTGLTQTQAQTRIQQDGPNQVATNKPLTWYQLLFRAFNDPFVYVLLGLIVVSVLTQDFEGATVMTIMVLLSVTIQFVQESRSQAASQALKKMIQNTTAITRDGQTKEIPITAVVPGDIVSLSTGDMIPGDALVLQAKDLFLNQSSLTGESTPVEKFATNNQDVDQTAVFDLQNIAYMGTDIISGDGQALILATGSKTFFGNIAESATKSRGTTSFERGMNRISRLLIWFMLVMTPIVFILNGITKHNWLEAFFFSISIAVGLTPEMLPMIVTTNLAKGAVTLSKDKVIIKELNSIQNLGGMNVLCTDKTGTLTENRVVVMQHVAPDGTDSGKVLSLAYLNSKYETGWKNLMDSAIVSYYEDPKITDEAQLPQTIVKEDEIPFDFNRRAISVVVSNGSADHWRMVTKGAIEEIIGDSNRYILNDQIQPLDDATRAKLKQVNYNLNEQGMRVIGVAYKDIPVGTQISKSDESNMIFAGFVGFLDPVKTSSKSAIDALHAHDVDVKILTGDNATITQLVAGKVDIPNQKVMLGTDLDQISDQDLKEIVKTTNIFAKLNPMQKERIIKTIQSNDQTVGYMGDGINDAPSLKQADVGISVDTATDITKDASSIILLEKDLMVLNKGIIDGRKVFVNTMKYIKNTVSSNFGNVFSVLIASAFLPFLPMLSIQLLVQNLIYDTSQLAIPWDHVDASDIKEPTSWDAHGLLSYTLLFGPLSSIFDVITFAFLWFGLHADTIAMQHMFQAGWFIEGLFTQCLVVHVLRTSKIPVLQSNASSQLYLSTFMALLVGVLLVTTPIRNAFKFAALPGNYWPVLFVIVLGYLTLVQTVKYFYIKKTHEWL